MSVSVARVPAQRLPRRSNAPTPEPLALRILEWSVILPVILMLGGEAWASWSELKGQLFALVAWLPVVCIADLLPVTLWDCVQLTMSLPILLAAGMVYTPPIAGLLGFVASTDTRVLRGEIGIPRALFNRSHIALSVTAASAAFHGLGGDIGLWPAVIGMAFLSLMADMVINNGLTILGLHLLTAEPLRVVVRNIYGRGRPLPFLLGYLCFGLMAVLLATVYKAAADWGLIAFVIPVFLARQMFEHNRRLLEASDELVAKDRLLLSVSERIADERRDERLTVAADLHDEVLPPLYKVHLMGEVLRQDLAAGRLLELEDDLPGLLDATQRANDAIRLLIGNLRKSPLGRLGVAGTLRLLARQLETESPIRFELHAEEVSAAPLVQLLAYQVVREAMVNAVRHSGAAKVAVSVTQDDAFIRLGVVDDGRGFDPRHVDRNTHFGLQLMRERVELVGGVFQLHTSPDGTQIVARLPGEIRV